ncbi:hypothetical protein G7Z17_g6220 [Cylindrodendrum hubeiense]|uniref:SnoaL-like domain-containing protein n=1 Tax=Cylindrodendrum hubeiense TaxID=595255 RepID=A0A9P5H9G1_9HYPO|nr:hypothetical protein G7Z17_g6220 [Cylindrodendrum hubeiense]
MASPRSAEDIVRSVYRAFQSANAEVVERCARELLAADAVLVEAESLPWGGRYEGIESVVATIIGVASPESPIDAANLVIDDMIVREGGGDSPSQVIAAVSFPWRGPNKRIPMRSLEWFTVQNGKVTELRIYLWDTAAAISALAA